MSNKPRTQTDHSYLDTPNAFDQIINENWKTEDDYKRTIVSLELQNEKYRNELYELGETVNKILEKSKAPQQNRNVPNMESQLELVKKELHNVNQFIEIYQKELSSLGGKRKQEQMESIANTEEILRARVEELATLKKEVREVSHKNKGIEYKLMEYNRRNKAKSLDQQAIQLKDLINENKTLKYKIEELESLQEKKQAWLKSNISSAQDLQNKVKKQESELPKIRSRSSLREQSVSLPKLQNEKKVYAKWLESSRVKSYSKIDQELDELGKINETVLEKIRLINEEIVHIKENTKKMKEKVEANELLIGEEELEDQTPKKKDVGTSTVKRMKKIRREWIGKFDSLRFSDSRITREETRIYKILFNTCGYYQFFYYSVKDKNKLYVGKLPFDTSSLISNGEESTFTVEHPDFIKGFILKLNIKTNKVLEMTAVSNLGLKAEFKQPKLPSTAISNSTKKQHQEQPLSLNEQSETEVYYNMEIKPNEAVSCMFGSYGIKTDEKKNIMGVWLEGLGCELMEDYVEEEI